MMEELKRREFGRLKILDSIRGIAALVVLYHHIFKLNKEVFQNNLSDTSFVIFDFVSGLNKEAVLLFFIISGFSIGLSTLKRPLNDRKSINGYFYRRFKRILPIYWIAIFLSLLVGIGLNLLYLRDFSFLNLMGNLVFLQTSDSLPESWVIPYGMNGPLWSLSYEMFFYVLFPLVYFINKKFLKKLGLYTKYVALLLVILLGIIINKKVVFIPYFLFLIGFIIWIQGYISSYCFVMMKKKNLFFFLNLLVGLAITIANGKIPSDSIELIGKGMLLNGIFYFTMILTDGLNTQKIQKFIDAIFYKLGEGSYAIYALHYPLLIFFQEKGVSLIYQLLFLPLFIVCCYHLEKHSIRWKMTFLDRNYLKLIQFTAKS
ncbi:acyltransferase family protein [Zobellia barbeyronii]|uniref:Acyltransferase n=1 Tax=Zobellia barbeyronii TaxID=2748009 RepID=A0ABS5W950_9FLAO|nr:acyltransferase [Zobellia barbeyronii]MBT2159749.1 acyltransferase [Zobellia barbeyronii]